MTTPSPSDPGRENLPDHIPAPPPPKPHLKDPRGEGPTYGGDPKKKKRGRGRSHPTDTFPPLKKKRGCCGCIGGMALTALLAGIAVVLVSGWFGPGRFVKQGYTVVNLGSGDATVDTAPSEPTYYLAPDTLDWRVPVTTVPVAITAREIRVAGDFHEEVSLTAIKVMATEAARFAKDLEVFALEFTDGGITLKGELKGSVMKNIP